VAGFHPFIVAPIAFGGVVVFMLDIFRSVRPGVLSFCSFILHRLLDIVLEFAGGVYIHQLRVGSLTEARKMVIIK
jgi:hypothetical protein